MCEPFKIHRHFGWIRNWTLQMNNNEVMKYSYPPSEYCGRIVFKMAAELKETAAEKPMFTCSSCGFQCHYEYFGKKPPFSKSVLYVYCFRCIYVYIFFLHDGTSCTTLVCDSSKNVCDFKPPKQIPRYLHCNLSCCRTTFP